MVDAKEQQKGPHKMPQLPTPQLPEPAHPDVDSMLSRKFGKEIANYFSGMSSKPPRVLCEHRC